MARKRLPPELDERLLESSAWDPRAQPVDPFVAWLDQRLVEHRARRLWRRWLFGGAAAALVATLVWWLVLAADPTSSTQADPPDGARSEIVAAPEPAATPGTQAALESTEAPNGAPADVALTESR
jgi:hypothetical protein